MLQSKLRRYNRCILRTGSKGNDSANVAKHRLLQMFGKLRNMLIGDA